MSSECGSGGSSNSGGAPRISQFRGGTSSDHVCTPARPVSQAGSGADPDGSQTGPASDSGSSLQSSRRSGANFLALPASSGECPANSLGQGSRSSGRSPRELRFRIGVVIYSPPGENGRGQPAAPASFLPLTVRQADYGPVGQTAWNTDHPLDARYKWISPSDCTAHRSVWVPPGPAKAMSSAGKPVVASSHVLPRS